MSPDQTVSQSEASQDLSRCLHDLPSEQRDVVMWRTYEGLPFEEIADRQGICASTARGRYRYGIGKLQHLMRNSA